jgi:hypothetical protein
MCHTVLAQLAPAQERGLDTKPFKPRTLGILAQIGTSAGRFGQCRRKVNVRERLERVGGGLSPETGPAPKSGLPGRDRRALQRVRDWPPAENVTRARKYACHFYFRRTIPVEVTVPTRTWPPFKFEVMGLDDLRPGRHSGLDLICEVIRAGWPFIYPAEAQFESDGSPTEARVGVLE